MYVNNFTIEMGTEGKKSISKLMQLAKESGILEKDVELKYSY
jgi:predicted solute-binding protein